MRKEKCNVCKKEIEIPTNSNDEFRATGLLCECLREAKEDRVNREKEKIEEAIGLYGRHHSIVTIETMGGDNTRIMMAHIIIKPTEKGISGRYIKKVLDLGYTLEGIHIKDGITLMFEKREVKL